MEKAAVSSDAYTYMYMYVDYYIKTNQLLEYTANIYLLQKMVPFATD